MLTILKAFKVMIDMNETRSGVNITNLYLSVATLTIILVNFE